MRLRRSCFSLLERISTVVPHRCACAKARYNAKMALPKPLWSLTMRKGSHCFVALPSASAPAGLNGFAGRHEPGAPTRGG